MNTQAIGQAAEQLACRYLQSQGLRHISQNFNRRMGEIDLIMFDDKANSWVLVEVRYRKNSRYGNAVVSVDRNKQSKLKVGLIGGILDNFRIIKAILLQSPKYMISCLAKL